MKKLRKLIASIVILLYSCGHFLTGKKLALNLNHAFSFIIVLGE